MAGCRLIPCFRTPAVISQVRVIHQPRIRHPSDSASRYHSHVNVSGIEFGDAIHVNRRFVDSLTGQKDVWRTESPWFTELGGGDCASAALGKPSASAIMLGAGNDGSPCRIFRRVLKMTAGPDSGVHKILVRQKIRYARRQPITLIDPFTR